MDGIDAALVEIREDGERLHCDLAAFLTVPYEPALRARLIELLEADAQAAVPVITVREICALNFSVGEAFAAAARELLAEGHTPTGLHAAPDLIASHGQTIYHLMQAEEPAPARYVPSTLQVGEPAVIAERTGVTCVADFRVADVAAGGTGAPLVPYADHALLGSDSEFRVALNIGGIANITVLPAACEADQVSAFDTGPGNMLIDRAIRVLYPGSNGFDEDGALARRGRVSPQLLDWLLSHPYFKAAPPKTAGHEIFGSAFGDRALAKAEAFGCSAEDTVATLTALTARTIADAVPDGCERVIVSGGGSHNATLLAMLGEMLANSRPDRHRERRTAPLITPSDEFGLPSDAKESIAFAVLGYQALRGKAAGLPSVTGARQAAILGKIVPGRNYEQLMRAVWA